MSLMKRKRGDVLRIPRFNPGSVYNRAAMVIQRGARDYLAKRARTQSYNPFGFSQRSAASTQVLGRSGTHTGTDMKRQRAQSDPLGGSTSQWTLKRPAVNLGGVGKVVTPHITVNNTSGRLTSAIGQQSVGIVASHFNIADYTALMTTSYGATVKSRKLLMKHVSSTVLITNQESVPCYYTIYDLIARRDGNATVTDPLVAFTGGMADAQGAIAGSYLVPGVDPFSNPRFVEYFNIKQVTSGTLLPGNVHTHRVYYEPNFIGSHEIDSFTTNYIKGLTHYTIIVFHGTPENDSTTKTQVSLSACALDYVVKNKYVTKAIELNYEAANATNSLPTAFGVGGEVINEFTGAAIPDLAA